LDGLIKPFYILDKFEDYVGSKYFQSRNSVCPPTKSITRFLVSNDSASVHKVKSFTAYSTITYMFFTNFLGIYSS